jgi:hypothetical protein
MKRYQVRSSASSILEWSHAETLADFIFPWESREAPKTEFRALWDETHLHFRFDCQDDDLVLPDGPTAKDRIGSRGDLLRA